MTKMRGETPPRRTVGKTRQDSVAQPAPIATATVVGLPRIGAVAEAKTAGARAVSTAASITETGATAQPEMSVAGQARTAPKAPEVKHLLTDKRVIADRTQRKELPMMAKDQMDKLSSNFFKSYEDATALGRGSFEAAVKSSTVMAKGFEEVSRALMALAQSNMEAAVATAKAAFGATTLRQVVDLHTDYAKTSFDKMVTESNKLSELSFKVANEALEPIQTHVNQAVDRLVKVAA